MNKTPLFFFSRKQIKSFLTSPVTLISATVLGALCGFVFPGFSNRISICGEVYLNFLQLVTVPLVICSMGSGLTLILQQNKISQNSISLGKMAVILISCMLLFGTLGMVCECAFQHFAHSRIDLEQLDEMIHQKEGETLDRSIRILEPPKAEEGPQVLSVRDMLVQCLPTNIFRSLSQGNMIHLLIFSVLSGIAMGMLPQKVTEGTISLLQTSYQACLYLIQCSLYVMPVCVFCLMADGVTHIDPNMAKMITRMLGTIILAEILLIVFGLFCWSRVVHMSVRQLIKHEYKTLLMAFTSCSSMVTMPLVMQDLEEKMHYSRETVGMTLPVIFTVGRFSAMFHLCIISVFIGNLYYGAVSTHLLFLLPFLALPMAIANMGPLSISILLKILGYPDELGIIMLTALVSFSDSFNTVMNVIYNSFISSLSAVREKVSR